METRLTTLMDTKKIQTSVQEAPSGPFVDYDVLIVGGGVAGFTSALFVARRGLKVAVISGEVGGQASAALIVDNYPGVQDISGHNLVETMRTQATEAGATYIESVAQAIKKEESYFITSTTGEVIKSHAVVVACGKTPKPLGVPREDEFIHAGINYCQASQLDEYKDKKVVVVGGGNSALGMAQAISSVAESVAIIHRRDVFTAEATIVEQVRSNSRIALILNSMVTNIVGQDHITGLEVTTLNTNNTSEIMVDEVLVAVGFELKTDFVGSLIEKDATGQLLADTFGATKTPGLFAAGDCTNTPYKQMIVAAGQAASAGITAAHYVATLTGRRLATLDWGQQSKR